MSFEYCLWISIGYDLKRADTIVWVPARSDTVGWFSGRGSLINPAMHQEGKIYCMMFVSYHVSCTRTIRWKFLSSELKDTYYTITWRRELSWRHIFYLAADEILTPQQPFEAWGRRMFVTTSAQCLCLFIAVLRGGVGQRKSDDNTCWIDDGEVRNFPANWFLWRSSSTSEEVKAGQ